MRIHQISVFLENRAGQLAELTRLLANNGVDMRAISIAETADYIVLFNSDDSACFLCGLDAREENERRHQK